MNRILLRADELDPGSQVHLTGRRADHLRRVLRADVGQVLRIGVLDGPQGTAAVMQVSDDEVVLACMIDGPAPPRPRLNLLLAVPRPKIMRRLWAPLASIGVDQVVITNAEKVERCYFDTHWLSPGTYEEELTRGLEQAGRTHLPRVTIKRRLKPFVEDELPGMFGGATKLLCHPAAERMMYDAIAPDGSRLLVAVGPEPGWTDFEMDLMQSHGFSPVTIGAGTLRSDVACIAALSIAGHLAEA